jgi:hypothetical protein
MAGTNEHPLAAGTKRLGFALLVPRA